MGKIKFKREIRELQQLFFGLVFWVCEIVIAMKKITPKFCLNT